MSRNHIKPIVLAGTGRSGTSWLLDILTLDYDYRSIFEPLHNIQVPSAADFYYLYLVENDNHPALEKYMYNVFYNHTREAWLRWMHFGISKETPIIKKTMQYMYSLPKFKFWAKNRVIKLIKGNLMLGWLQKQFDVNIVYLIRHPCAVVSSQKRMGWNVSLNRFMEQANLIEAYLAPHLDVIKTAETDTQKLAILWCIENVVVFRQLEQLKLHASAYLYEDIVCEPERQLKHILSNLDLPLHKADKFLSKMKKRMPPKKETLGKWKSSLSNYEIGYILDAVNSFGINLYGDNILPINPDQNIFKSHIN
ncbi:MAG: hypothetical protein GY777_18615 [Candidatus Brocadiaceae bacterium]|nr:hypothetical protein [Candidatus Brocadiaceae bacterium]